MLLGIDAAPTHIPLPSAKMYSLAVVVVVAENTKQIDTSTIQLKNKCILVAVVVVADAKGSNI